MSEPRVYRRRIRRSKGGVNLAADVEAVVAANVGEAATRTRVSRKSSVRVVQRRSSNAGDEPAGDGS